MKLGILFDLDGTLLSSDEDLADSVNYTLAQYGCPERTLEEIRSFLGYGAPHLIRSAMPGKEDDPPFEEVFATYKEHYATHSQIKTRPYDGILEALEDLRKDFPIAVVSNKPDRYTKPLCLHYFGEGIYALGDDGICPKKPAADMLRKAMAALKVDSCIYVGDSEVDILTAKNTGVKSLGVLWGFRDRDCLMQAGADRLCERPVDMAAILREMAREDV